ncbi:hypothetical protein Tco_0462605 [Tanacetum coccineum]
MNPLGAFPGHVSGVGYPSDMSPARELSLMSPGIEANVVVSVATGGRELLRLAMRLMLIHDVKCTKAHCVKRRLTLRTIRLVGRGMAGWDAGTEWEASRPTTKNTSYKWFPLSDNKKRRLPKSQVFPDDGVVDNHSPQSLSRRHFGNVSHHEFPGKLRLELSPAVSDINFVSNSTQSSNEDGESSQFRLSEG